MRGLDRGIALAGGLSDIRSRLTAEHLVIVALLVFYAHAGLTEHWIFPGPSDPLQYVTPGIWGSTVFNDSPTPSTSLIYWAWIDRVSVIIGTRLLHLVTGMTLSLGPAYILIVNLLTIALAAAWATRKGGALAGVLVAMLLVTSNLFRTFATYVYADQTLALLSLTAFAIYFWHEAAPTHRRLFIVGMVCVAAVFAKGLGVATGLFFGLHILATTRPFRAALDRLIWLGGGAIAGLVAVFVVFTVLFGFGSVRALATGFLYQNFQLIAVGTNQGNLVSYIPQIFDRLFIPILVAPFILATAYLHKVSRVALLMAASHFAVLTAVYAFTTRGGAAHVNYLYPTLLFAGIGTGLALARPFGDGVGGARSVPVALAIIVALIVGALVRRSYVPTDPAGWFQPGHAYRGPFALFWFIPIGALALLVLLTLTQVLSQQAAAARRAAAAVAILGALWGEIHTGGSARARSTAESVWHHEFVSISTALDAVPGESFSVYVKAWEKQPWDRVLTTYTAFHGRHQGRATARTPLEFQERIFKNLIAIKSSQLPLLAPGALVLTDVPDELLKIGAVEHARVRWNDRTLIVLQLRPKG